MIARRAVLQIAFGMLALTSTSCTQEPKPITFCELASGDRPLHNQHVRVQVVGVFSDHGVGLRDPSCPTFSADWEESKSFRGSPSWQALLDAIWKHESTELQRETLDFYDLQLDLTARIKWKAGRAALVVDHVYSTRPTPRVYRSEYGRVEQICFFGNFTKREPERTRRACERAAALRPAQKD